MALISIIGVTSLISSLVIVQMVRAHPFPQNSQGNPRWNGPGGQLNNRQDLDWSGPGQRPGWNGPLGQENSGQPPGWNGQGQDPGWNGQGQRPGWSGQGQGSGWSGPPGQVNSGPGSYFNPSGEYSYQNQYPNALNYLYLNPNPSGMNPIQPANWNYGYNPNNNNAGSIWNRGQIDPGSYLALSQFPSGNGLMNNIPPGGPLNGWRNNYGGVSGSYPNQNMNQRTLDINEKTKPKGKQ